MIGEPSLLPALQALAASAVGTPEAEQACHAVTTAVTGLARTTADRLRREITDSRFGTTAEAGVFTDAPIEKSLAEMAHAVARIGRTEDFALGLFDIWQQAFQGRVADLGRGTQAGGRA